LTSRKNEYNIFIKNNDTDGRFYKPIDYLPSNLPEENRLPNETIKEQIDDGQQDEIRFEQIIQRRPIKEIACIDLSSEDDSENTPNGELQQQKTPFWQVKTAFLVYTSDHNDFTSIYFSYSASPTNSIRTISFGTTWTNYK
jgi:hypothetical protein